MDLLFFKSEVLKTHAGAIAHRSSDGRWHIHYRVPIATVCTHCARRVESTELSLDILGSGKNEREAWRSAYRNILRHDHLKLTA